MGRGAPNLRPPHGGSSALRALLHKPGLLIKMHDAVEQTVLHVATPAGRGRGEVGGHLRRGEHLGISKSCAASFTFLRRLFDCTDGAL